MMQATAVNAYVFAFCFAASFLMTGKRPILQLSTRFLLVVVLAFALSYVLSDRSAWHGVIGAGALVLNLVFIGFALIDCVNWQKAKAQR
jgi:hypothetical protein